MKRTLLSISALFLAAATFAQPTNGLVAHYTFTGGLVEDHQGANDGVANMAVPTSDRFGSASSAFSFNATNEALVSIPDDNALDFGSGDFTYSVWFRTTETDNVGVILNKGQGTSGVPRIFIRTNAAGNGSVQWRMGSSSNNTQTGHLVDQTLFDGNWHHVAIVRENITMRCYIDGFLTDEVSLALFGTADISDDRPLLLGAQDSVVANSTPMGGFFNGDIDDLRIYDRVLTTNEVIEVYQEQGTAVDLTNGLLGQYSFNAGTADDDLGQNNGVNHNATLTTDRFGNPNQAFEFDPNNTAYIEVPHSSTINFGDTDFSVSYWFNSSNSSNIGMMLNKGQGSSSNNRIFVRCNVSNPGDMQWRVGGGGATNVTDSEIFLDEFDGDWHHVVLVRYLNQMMFYMDGALATSVTDNNLFTESAASNRPVLFGASDSIVSSQTPMGAYFDGSLDDVFIYGRALNANEVNELFNLTNTPIITSTSANPESKSALVYPNPTNGTVYIANLNEAEVRTINLYDVTGSLVKSQPQAIQVDMTDLPKGIYLLTADMIDGSRLTSRVARN